MEEEIAEDAAEHEFKTLSRYWRWTEPSEAWWTETCLDRCGSKVADFVDGTDIEEEIAEHVLQNTSLKPFLVIIGGLRNGMRFGERR